MSIPTSPPPGWYVDPQSPSSARWFDGASWTAHVQPLGAPPPTAPDHGPSTALHWVLPVGRSWQSILAGYVALVAMVTWTLAWAGGTGAVIGLAVAAVTVGLGAWALHAAAAGGHGRGRAWFAVVVGTLSLAACVWLLLQH